jgi:hypothetical protein
MNIAAAKTGIAKNVCLYLWRFVGSYPEWNFAPRLVQVHRTLPLLGADYGSYTRRWMNENSALS